MIARREGDALRVLHVVPYFAPAYRYGGPPRSVLALCQALRAAGVEAEVFTTTADGPRDLPASGPDGDWFEGVPVRYFARRAPRGLFNAAGLGPALAAAMRRMDVVHVHGLWHAPGWLAARAARRASVPYVLSPRGMLDPGAMGHHRLRKLLLYRLVERRHLAGARLLVASSPAEAEAIARWCPGAPISIVPNAVRAPLIGDDDRRAWTERLGAPPGAPLIAYVGRIHPVKRLDLLALAYRRVRERHPSARLVIAGPDDHGHRRDIEPLLAPVADGVHWTGLLEDRDKWALLASARAAVVCSDSESFGMSVLEAMAAGTPVVVTRTCPWAEVEEAGCGFWVAQTPEAIADGLSVLVADPALARAMGARGRAHALSAYSWDRAAEAMAREYERAAGRSRPAPVR